MRAAVLSRSFSHTPDGDANAVVRPAATPAYTWITSGNLGEPLLLTDASGALSSSVTRDPWGNPVLLAGGVPLELGYPGQWKDPATGLPLIRCRNKVPCNDL